MKRSILETDGYKFSMAEAGFPLRTETFHYVHRRGGPQILPVDVRCMVAGLLPAASDGDFAFLEGNHYGVGPGFRHAARPAARVVVRALPKMSVFYPGEPVFSVTGPSVLASWLEPLVLQLAYRIQLATLARSGTQSIAEAVATVTCREQREIVLETFEACCMEPPPIQVDEDGYRSRVLKAAKGLVRAAGDPSRIFEVGLRSATCTEQHRIALSACAEAGIQRTSNVFLARELGMIPVGTMGHEHVQRYGSDEAAFRAMKDRRPGRSSFLLDTYDTFLSGIPAAFRVMADEPEAGDSIRYDSGDKAAQLVFAETRARSMGLRPIHIVEDGLDEAGTVAIEKIREVTGIEAERVFYGYGGYLVAAPAAGGLTRDRVQAVYKLCQTGPEATMKFAGEANGGKESLPGQPVVWRRTGGQGPAGIIGQYGEECPDGYRLLTDAKERHEAWPDDGFRVIASPGTEALKVRLRAERARRVAGEGRPA